MTKHSIAAVFVCVLSSVAAHASSVAAMPVSASQPPSLTANANVARVTPAAGDSTTYLRPELLGAAAIGLYALYKGRHRRIV